MATQIQVRNDTAANWTSADPTLATGEFGYETDTGQVKVGDGSTAWTSLGYFGVSSTYVDNAISGLIDAAPTALNTLNELAAALGDDANFATTVTNSLSGKQDVVTGVTSTEIGYLSNVTSDIQTQIDSKAPLSQTISTKTADYTLQASDSGTIIKVNGTVTLTIPSSTIPAGGRIDVVNVGSGVVTFAGSGVTISSKDSKATIATQYSAATLISDSTTTAILVGDIA